MAPMEHNRQKSMNKVFFIDLFLKLLFEVLSELFRVHKGKIDCILFYLRRNFKRIFLLNFYCYATLRRKKIKDIPFYILLFSLFIREY
jgi:hypothetical protein